jgi:hypothetical protein
MWGDRKANNFFRINNLHTVNTLSRPPGTLPLGEGKGRGWGLLTHEQRNYTHFFHFAIAMQNHDPQPVPHTWAWYH